MYGGYICVEREVTRDSLGERTSCFCLSQRNFEIHFENRDHG